MLIEGSSENWFVYIIQADDTSLYTGITKDIVRRWNEHTHSPKGAKFFRGRKPEYLFFVSQFDNRSMATKEEVAIKKLTRKQKLELKDSSDNLAKDYRASLNKSP